jgi:hypothetical protein
MPQIRHPVQYAVHLVGLRHYFTLWSSDFVRSYSSVARACSPPVRRNAARPVPAGAADKEEEEVVDETAGQIKIQAAP